MCTHNKISHLNVLQRTTPSGSGALAFLFYTRTLQLPPTTFLILWLLNKLQSAVVEGTQTTSFLTKMNNNISYMKGSQRITPSGLGALAFLQYIRILQLPPTTFLLLWLQDEIHFTIVEGTQTTSFLTRNQQPYILFERVVEDNT